MGQFEILTQERMVIKERIQNGPTFVVPRTFKFDPSLVKRSTLWNVEVAWGLEA